MNNQPNLGALNANDWRLVITEQARTQNLQNITANIIQSFSPQHKANAMKVMLQYEAHAFANSQSSQEYIAVLRDRVAEFEQSLKALAPSNHAAGVMAAGVNNQQQPAASAGNGVVSAEEIQKWRAAFAKIKRVFYYNNANVSVNLLDAHAVLNLLKQRRDTQNEEIVRNIIQEIMETAQNEVDTPLTKEIVQAVLHDSSTSMSFGSAAQKQLTPGEAQMAPALNAALANHATLGNPPAANAQQQQPQQQHGALQGQQDLLSSPAASVGALPAGQQSNLNTNTPVAVQSAVSPATHAAVKKQVSGKNSPSVASAKPKKKSQSPKTATKARKGASPKPSSATSTASTVAQAQANVTTAAATASSLAEPVVPTASEMTSVFVQSTVPGAAGVSSNEEAALGPAVVPGMQRQESMSAETAARIVETIVKAMEAEPVMQRPRINLSESDKKAVRDHLVIIGQLLSINQKLMAVLFLATKSQDPIQKICTIDIVVREQRRLLTEDQYIIGPAHTTNFIDMLRRFFTIAKEWGNMQQHHDPAGAGASQRQQTTMSSGAAQPQAQVQTQMYAHTQPATMADRETPLTNMHPDAITADPSFENFQKAVKHPLDPGNLKLPAAKKRQASKGGSSAAGNQVLSPDGSGGPHHQSSAPFAPAPVILPPNMSRAEFDKLPLDARALILKNQQTMLIRQHAIGMNGSAGAPDALFLQQQAMQQQQQMGGANGQAANPLLLATAQGMSANANAAQTAEEQRLRELESNKWNNPLDYLMGVLDRFTKGAERAGVEPKPILQQAFWPIARKSMSSGWGVVASDAVL
ncbi:hypothetical protein J3B02_001133 [Coemansia erecta]|nr:hypothetical protein J3B02_001133 [Coemansia erecta]